MRGHWTVLFLAIGALGAMACANSDTEIDPETRAAVVALGDSAAMTLVRTLGGRLNGHLATNGPEGAIAFCSSEALALTDSVSQALGEGWHIKRTTRQTRNPGNAPDSLEAVALEQFYRADAAGTELENLVQRTDNGSFRYYMPLRVGHMCLQCHGDRDALDPAVVRVLDARYPADQATGYSQGDLRGAVRVTVPSQAVR
jgi:hypothetical protein